MAKTIYKVKEVFKRYKEVDTLSHADIFHLYDTKIQCAINNDGFNDSRHFILWVFNTKSMQKVNLGRHDGITNLSNVNVSKIRIFADGSTMLRFNQPISIMNEQCVLLVK